MVSEVSKLVRNAGIDLTVMGTSVPAGESNKIPPLGPVVADTILWASCPVLVCLRR